MVSSSQTSPRKGVQILIFKSADMGPKFLLLHRCKNWRGWEFPKGGTKKGESNLDAVLRELFEETGLSARDLLHVWPTYIDMQINYSSKNNRHISGSYQTFLVKVKSSSSARVVLSNEHDCFDWVDAQKVIRRLNRSNLKSVFKRGIRAVSGFEAVFPMTMDLKTSFKNRFVGVLLYGSQVFGESYEKSDYDLILILTKKRPNDLRLIKKLIKKHESMQFDFQLFYSSELSPNGNLFSWDSTGVYYFFVIREAIPVIGINPISSIRPPTKKALRISILNKMQYYVYRIRQAAIKNDLRLRNYFLKRLPFVLRMLLLSKGVWLRDCNCIADIFPVYYPNALSVKNLELLRKKKHKISYADLVNLYEQLYYALFRDIYELY